jgi:hypothetical protein
MELDADESGEGIASRKGRDDLAHLDASDSENTQPFADGKTPDAEEAGGDSTGNAEDLSASAKKSKHDGKDSFVLSDSEKQDEDVSLNRTKSTEERAPTQKPEGATAEVAPKKRPRKNSRKVRSHQKKEEGAVKPLPTQGRVSVRRNRQSPKTPPGGTRWNDAKSEEGEASRAPKKKGKVPNPDKPSHLSSSASRSSSEIENAPLDLSNSAQPKTPPTGKNGGKPSRAESRKGEIRGTGGHVSGDGSDERTAGRKFQKIKRGGNLGEDEEKQKVGPPKAPSVLSNSGNPDEGVPPNPTKSTKGKTITQKPEGDAAEGDPKKEVAGKRKGRRRVRGHREQEEGTAEHLTTQGRVSVRRNKPSEEVSPAETGWNDAEGAERTAGRKSQESKRGGNPGEDEGAQKVRQPRDSFSVPGSSNSPAVLPIYEDTPPNEDVSPPASASKRGKEKDNRAATKVAVRKGKGEGTPPTDGGKGKKKPLSDEEPTPRASRGNGKDPEPARAESRTEKKREIGGRITADENAEETADKSRGHRSPPDKEPENERNAGNPKKPKTSPTGQNGGKPAGSESRKGEIRETGGRITADENAEETADKSRGHRSPPSGKNEGTKNAGQSEESKTEDSAAEIHPPRPESRRVHRKRSSDSSDLPPIDGAKVDLEDFSSDAEAPPIGQRNPPPTPNSNLPTPQPEGHQPGNPPPPSEQKVTGRSSSSDSEKSEDAERKLRDATGSNGAEATGRKRAVKGRRQGDKEEPSSDSAKSAGAGRKLGDAPDSDGAEAGGRKRASKGRRQTGKGTGQTGKGRRQGAKGEPSSDMKQDGVKNSNPSDRASARGARKPLGGPHEGVAEAASKGALRPNSDGPREQHVSDPFLLSDSGKQATPSTEWIPSRSPSGELLSAPPEESPNGATPSPRSKPQKGENRGTGVRVTGDGSDERATARKSQESKRGGNLGEDEGHKSVDKKVKQNGRGSSHGAEAGGRESGVRERPSLDSTESATDTNEVAVHGAKGKRQGGTFPNNALSQTAQKRRPDTPEDLGEGHLGVNWGAPTRGPTGTSRARAAEQSAGMEREIVTPRRHKRKPTTPDGDFEQVAGKSHEGGNWNDDKPTSDGASAQGSKMPPKGVNWAVTGGASDRTKPGTSRRHRGDAVEAKNSPEGVDEEASRTKGKRHRRGGNGEAWEQPEKSPTSAMQGGGRGTLAPLADGASAQRNDPKRVSWTTIEATSDKTKPGTPRRHRTTTETSPAGGRIDSFEGDPTGSSGREAGASAKNPPSGPHGKEGEEHPTKFEWPDNIVEKVRAYLRDGWGPPVPDGKREQKIGSPRPKFGPFDAAFKNNANQKTMRRNKGNAIPLGTASSTSEGGTPKKLGAALREVLEQVGGPVQDVPEENLDKIADSICSYLARKSHEKWSKKNKMEFLIRAAMHICDGTAPVDIYAAPEDNYAATKADSVRRGTKDEERVRGTGKRLAFNQINLRRWFHQIAKEGGLAHKKQRQK